MVNRSIKAHVIEGLCCGPTTKRWRKRSAMRTHDRASVVTNRWICENLEILLTVSHCLQVSLFLFSSFVCCVVLLVSDIFIS